MDKAFSLVELSIVIVILGLLVGGILAGQSLIKAAELRKVGSFQSEFVAATNIFKDRYFAFPGDMNNATRFWGVLNTPPAHGHSCALSTSTTPTATGVCDGDGDGFISWATGRGVWERTMFGDHLRKAGLINVGASGMFDTPGLSKARSFMGGCDWCGARYGDLYTYMAGGSKYVGNALQTTQVWPYAFMPMAGAVITPEALWSIDTKIDDGKPQSGRLRGMDGLDISNSTMTMLPCVHVVGSTPEYNVTYARPACRFLLALD